MKTGYQKLGAMMASAFSTHRHRWRGTLLVCESDGGCQVAIESCNCGEERNVDSDLAYRWRHGEDLKVVTRTWERAW